MCEGGGYLVGRVDSEGEFSGSSMAFIYPDLCTALLGTFHTQQMVACQAVTLTGLSSHENICLKWFKLQIICFVGYSLEPDQPLELLQYINSFSS